MLDATDVRFHLRTIQAGAWLSVACVGLFATYHLLTWERPGRTPLLIALGFALVFSLAITRLPMERWVIRTRGRDLFFLSWSGSLALMVGWAYYLDGPRSPLILALFLPLVFGALSYPVWSVVALGIIDVTTFGAVSVALGDTDLAASLAVIGSLLLATWMCAWQSRNHARHRAELARVSRAEALTGSLNRRGFSERLAAELSHAGRSGRPLSLILLDLDGFKEINDTRGHAAGDGLLRWTVAEIARTVRPMDAVGRLGGDEFAVVLPEAGREQGLEIAGRLRAALADRAPASVGLASFPNDGLDAEELLGHADAQLYTFKHARTATRPRRQDLSWAAALAHAVDLRMAGQHDHSHAVGELAALIGERLGWSEQELGRLRVAGLLHDVGKVAIPDAILRKPGPLDDDERRAVQRHPEVGAEMVARIDGLGDVAVWIGCSHEHFDGTGYPAALEGEEIPLAARMLLVADAYDAMTSDRCYRRALDHATAVAELRRESGRQFDPACVEHLIAALAERASASLAA